MERKSREQRELKGFREMVVEEYLNGDKSARELGEYYGVSPNNIWVWTCNYRKKHRSMALASESVIFTAEPQTEEATMKRELTPEEKDLRIAELEKALAHEQMKVVVLNKMIDITEREFKIDVRKKCGAKQSEK